MFYCESTLKIQMKFNYNLLKTNSQKTSNLKRLDQLLVLIPPDCKHVVNINKL